MLAIVPICAALALYGQQIAAHALLSLGFASTAARVFDDPAWRGAALCAAGRWNEAVAKFESDAASAYNQGVALARAGNYQEAIDAFDRALAMNANDEDAAFNKALLEEALRLAPTSASGGVNGVLANSPATKAGGAKERPESDGQTAGVGAGLAAGRETESGGGAGGAAPKDGKANEPANFSRVVAAGAAADADGAGRSGDHTNVAELLRERERRMARRMQAGGLHPSLEWLHALPDDPGRFLKLRILAERMRRLRAAGDPLREDD